MHHPQSKHILVGCDVVFVEDAIQPVLAWVKELDMTSQNVYDTLLPFFNGGNVLNIEAHIWSLYSSNDGLDHPFFDVYV